MCFHPDAAEMCEMFEHAGSFGEILCRHLLRFLICPGGYKGKHMRLWPVDTSAFKKVFFSREAENKTELSHLFTNQTNGTEDEKYVVEGCLRVHASVKLKRKNECRE